MATKKIVILTDDMDGGDASRTVTFSFHGTNYEIDLNDTHVENLTAALEPFINAARKIGRGRNQKGTSKTGDLAAVRSWARDQGMQISDRGRVSSKILTAYQQRN